MYRDTKIERFDLHPNLAKSSSVQEDFDVIDEFKDTVKPYIFTDIPIRHIPAISIETAFQERLQMLMSAVLLRSLMLKEGLVTALNHSNLPAYYGALKSFFEVPALLGYVAELIAENDDYLKIIESMKPLTLGSGKAGGLRIGSVDAIKIGKMFEALDRVYKKMSVGAGESEEEVKKRENIFHALYGDVCNYGHINWNAHLSVGLQLDGVWRAHKEVDEYKRQLYAFYMPGFTLGIAGIKMMCSFISRSPKVSNFSRMSSPKYFQD